MRLPALLVLTLASSLHAAPVTLEDCITEALRGQPGLEAVAQKAKAARMAVTEAQSAYYPQLKVGAQWARTDNPPQAFFMRLNQRTASLNENFNQPEDTDNLRASASVGWMLFDFGQRSAMAQMARSQAEAQQDLVEAARNELAHQVTRAFVGVLQAQALTQIHAESLAGLKENLRVAAERVSAGAAIRSDVLNLQVSVAEADEAMIRARNGESRARLMLNNAIGHDVVGPEDPLTAHEPAPTPAKVSALRLEQRGEWRAAQAALHAREAAAAKARRGGTPSVQAFGSYDLDSGNQSDFENSYMMGVSAEMEVFSGGRRRGERLRTSAELEAARAELAQLSNQLQFDFRDAALQVAEAYQRLDVARQTVSSADEALRVTRERYAQGACGLAELLTAQAGHTGAKSRLVLARFDCLLAVSNQRRAAGNLTTESAP